MILGVDVASIARIEQALQRHPRFADRIFTAAEQRYCGAKAERWASRWAAKEAVRKLYGSARAYPLPWMHEIEVVRGGGAPRLRVRGADTSIALTLTHDAGVAIAVVAAESLADATVRLTAPPGMVLAARPDDGNKGTFGRVVVVAGARGFTGAPQLAALGAARGGAGLVTLCVADGIYPIVAGRMLEVMPAPLPDSGTGTLTSEGLDAVREHAQGASALVIGPGLGRAPATVDAVLTILRTLPCPTVVDADGLNIAAASDFDWHQAPHPVVLTPHPAEMARLLHSDTQSVQRDRQTVAVQFARERNVVLVLKGAETVIAAPDGRVHVDSHRVVALASGGTGDVLAGLLGSMLAQGLDPFDAAVAAVTVHANAGLLVEARRGRAGAIASDVIDALPEAQERLRRAIQRDAGARQGDYRS
ncbi:MAG: NAD(P)H-hydrate dehydratase [Candidatus Dormibacteraeota bacterium]|nr:NAD(P)H-hydrate dehydratase [Candidatus Dormibacteraeota bacterium]